MILLEGIITMFSFVFEENPLWFDFKQILLWQDPFFDLAQNDVEVIRQGNWGLNEADDETPDVQDGEFDFWEDDELSNLDKHSWDHVSDILL